MAYLIWSPPGSSKAARTYYVEGKGKYIKWHKKDMVWVASRK